MELFMIADASHPRAVVDTAGMPPEYGLYAGMLPAIVAALVLATARALGEAIMLSMVAGSVGFAPNPLDGLTFFFEPARPLASTIVDNSEGLSVVPFGQTMYAFAAILLVSSAFLSFAGWAARKSFSRYTLSAR